MKTIIEKIICILIILIVLFSINTKVYAWSQVFSDAQNFIATGENSNEANINAAGVQELSSYLYNILLSAGVVIAVIIATVLGIQFMTSSAEGQAKVKEALIPFVVGCIVVFGGFGIWKVGITIGQKLESSTESSTDYYAHRDGSKDAEDFAKGKTIEKVVEEYFRANTESVRDPSINYWNDYASRLYEIMTSMDGNKDAENFAKGKTIEEIEKEYSRAHNEYIKSNDSTMKYWYDYYNKLYEIMTSMD